MGDGGTMSSFVKHETPKPRGLKIALIIGAVWAVLIAILWLVYRNADGEGGGFLNFLGRFHVLIVHVPVGVVFLAFLMEIVSRIPSQNHIKSAIPMVLWVALLGGIGATVLGYLLMGTEGTVGKAMTYHLWTGLAVVVFTLLALVFLLLEKTPLYLLTLVASIISISAAGHFGGAMIHDEDYLAEYAPEPVKPLLLLGLGSAKKDANPNVEEGVVDAPLEEKFVYTELVVPILAGKCTECHDENKIKGKLRLDTHELIMAGAEGSDFPTVVPKDPENSELLVRVLLPSDDDDFMPPKGDALTAEEIKILSLWIQAGATPEITVAQLGDDPSILATAATVIEQHAAGADGGSDNWEPVWDTLTEEEREIRLGEAMAAAEQYNFSIMPISAEDDRLRVNVINAAKDFGDEQLALLDPVAEQILWLDLARSQITDDGLKTVSHMRNLERLHLENTGITDSGIAKLAPLKNLEYINIYGTEVGNAIFDVVKNMPKLHKLYAWQTKIDPAEARAFERSVNLEINTGVDLAITTSAEPEPAKGEEKPAPAPKPEEKKPEAQKPEPKKEEPKKPAATAPAKPAEKAKVTPPAKPAEKPKAAPAKPQETPPAKPAEKPKAAPEKPKAAPAADANAEKKKA